MKKLFFTLIFFILGIVFFVAAIAFVTGDYNSVSTSWQILGVVWMFTLLIMSAVCFATWFTYEVVE